MPWPCAGGSSRAVVSQRSSAAKQGRLGVDPRHERPVQSLGKNTTPAMAAGISDHIWTCEEIAALLD